MSGPVLSQDDRDLLRTGLGGVVLFSRNMASPDQLRRLTADIHAHATNPVVVAIDQEGGHVVRMGDPLTRLPSPMAIGATRDSALAYAVARASAHELAACGIDVVLAPVLDLAVQPASAAVGARSFGSDPGLVAQLGRAMVRGYLEGGVAPVGKHLPGHGRTAVDSNLDMPVIEADEDTLGRSDLLPFEAAVEAGVPGLMTAHIVYPALDPARPASLSPATTRLARRRLGFRGLIVTDALVMDAIAHRRPIEAAATEAVLAGADAVMALDPARHVIDRLEQEIACGAIPEERVVDALGHAGAFARRARSASQSVGRTPIGALAHRGAADRVARAALTLVSGAAGLPLRPSERVVVIDLGSARVSPVEDEQGSGESTGRALAEAWRAPLLRLETAMAAETAPIEAIRRAVGNADRAIVLSRDAFADASTASLVRSFLGHRTIHVALRSPTDLGLGHTGVRIAAYHEGPAVATALVRSLSSGPSAFPGELPVDAIDILAPERHADTDSAVA